MTNVDTLLSRVANGKETNIDDIKGVVKLMELFKSHTKNEDQNLDSNIVEEELGKPITHRMIEERFGLPHRTDVNQLFDMLTTKNITLELLKKIIKLDTENQSLRNAVERTNPDLSILDNELAQKDLKISELSKEIDNFKLLEEKHLSEVRKLETEISDLKAELQVKDESIKLHQKKTEKLSQRVNDLQELLKEADIEKGKISEGVHSLKLSVEEKQYKIDELNNTIEQIKSQSLNYSTDNVDEVITYKDSFDKLSTQLENQCVELSQNVDFVVKTKSAMMRLMNIIHQVSESIHKNEKIRKDLEGRLNLYKLKELNIVEFSKRIQDCIIYALKQHMNPLDKEYERYVDLITDDSNEIVDRVIDVIEALLERSNEPKLVEKVDDRLLKILKAQQLFLSKLVDDDNVRMLFTQTDGMKDPDLLDLLGQHSAVVQKFIEECGGVDEETGIFALFNMDADPMKMIDELQNYVETIGKPRTDEGRVLLSLLHHSVASNMIVRKNYQRLCCVYQSLSCQYRNMINEESKYGNENMVSCASADGQASNLNKNMTTMSQSEKEEKELITEKLEQTISFLRTKFLTCKDNNNDLIMEAIENLDKVRPLNVEQYNVELEHKYNELYNEMKQVKEKNNEMINELKDEIEKKNRIIDDRSEIQGKELEIKALKQNLEVEQYKLKEITNQYKVTKADYEKLKASSEARESRLQQEVDEIKLKFCNELNNVKKQNNDRINTLKEKKHDIKLRLNEARSTIERLNTIIADKEANILALENLKQKMYDENKRKAAFAREAEFNLYKQQAEYKEEISRLKSQVEVNEVDRKILSAKLKSSEEKFEKLKNSYETRISVNQAARDAVIKKLQGELETERRKKLDDFIIDVAHIFKDFVDFTQPITESSITQVLMNVNGIALSNNKVDEINNTEIKRILNVKRNSQMKPAILQLIEENNKIKEESTDLRNELSVLKKSMKLYKAEDWEEWCHRVLSGKSNASSVSEMRNTIEELIKTTDSITPCKCITEVQRTSKSYL